MSGAADSILLRAVRAALKVPFVDPVVIKGVTISRAEARAADRLLSKVERHGEHS